MLIYHILTLVKLVNMISLRNSNPSPTSALIRKHFSYLLCSVLVLSIFPKTISFIVLKLTFHYLILLIKNRFRKNVTDIRINNNNNKVGNNSLLKSVSIIELDFFS